MWQATIVSVSVLFISSLCQNVEDHKTATDIKPIYVPSTTLKFYNITNGTFPWIVSIGTEPNELKNRPYGIRYGRGVLITPRVVLIGSTCHQEELGELILDRDLMVYVQENPMEVEVGTGITLWNLNYKYIFLRLSQKVSDVQPIRIAAPDAQFTVGGMCYSISDYTSRPAQRIVIHANNSNYIYTMRVVNDCVDLPLEKGILVCKPENNPDYVLASVMVKTWDDSGLDCLMNFENLGRTTPTIRKGIKKVLKLQRYEYSMNDRNFGNNTNTFASS